MSVYLCECEYGYVCQQVCITVYVEVCHGQWSSVYEIRFGIWNVNFYWGREGTHRTFGKLQGYRLGSSTCEDTVQSLNHVYKE